MLQSDAELLRASRVPILMAVVLSPGASKQHLLKARVAPRVIFDAARERVTHVGEERAVIVDARHDVVDSLVHGVPGWPIEESHCRGYVERPTTGAQDRVVGNPVREAHTRRKLQRISSQSALRLSVARHQFERTSVWLSCYGVRLPRQKRVDTVGVEGRETVFRLVVRTGLLQT